jgi:predicted DNA-binding transcriptional regulator AlpA
MGRQDRRLTIQPRLLRADDAAEYCGVSASHWSALVKDGRAPGPVRTDALGQRVVVWDREKLDLWVDTLGDGGGNGFSAVD